MSRTQETIYAELKARQTSRHHPANCVSKAAFGADCPRCDATLPPYDRIRRCACCKTGIAVWTWQPFGPGESVNTFVTPGSHYRGFAALPCCDECKAAYQAGDAVFFSHKKVPYVAHGASVTETPF